MQPLALLLSLLVEVSALARTVRAERLVSSEESVLLALRQTRSRTEARQVYDADAEVLGLEGQDDSDRAKCMRDKEARPVGLLGSHLGATFPSKLQVDSLNSTQPLKGAVCSTEGGCGLFTLSKPLAAEGKACVREVPKLIHFVWLDHPMPEKYAKNVANVMKVNPDRRVLLWVNQEAKDVSALTTRIDTEFGADAPSARKRLLVKSIEEHQDSFRNWDIIQKEPNVGARSDWIRLEAVYQYGGIYMDTDVQPFQSFSSYGGVFRWPFVAYSDPKGYGNLCNCVFSAEKRSPLINLTMEGWREAFLHYKVPSGPPFGCPVLTAAFVTYNQPEIMMLSEDFMFKGPKNGVEPVMTMSFDGAWIDKGSMGRK